MSQSHESNIKWRVSVVSYEIVHALNQRAGGATPVFGQQTKVHDDSEPGEAIFHSNVVGKIDQLTRSLITQASARVFLERYVASEVISRIDM